MIYADHNATAPICPAARAALLAALDDGANPNARQHAPGRRARERIDIARQQVSCAIGARPDECIFTAGATEACNLAILGVMQRLLSTRPRLVIGATEHPAVREAAMACGRAGAEVVTVPVDAHGILDPTALAQAVAARTALVALMAVNHETGVIHAVTAAAAQAHAAGALLFCDATQVPGRMSVDVMSWGVDLLAVSSHKVAGPPGAGALYLRRGLGIAPLIHGGGQERGLRPGTENVPAIAGFGAAMADLHARLAERIAHLSSLTLRLETGMRKRLPDVLIHGAGAHRAPGTSFFGLSDARPGWLTRLVGVAASAGSACTSGHDEPSHVLKAMGVANDLAGNSIRIGLGVGTTTTEVDAIIDALVTAAT